MRTGLLWVLERTLGVVGELGPLNNPSFPWDQRKTVGLGFAVVVEPGKVVGTAGLIAFCVLRAVLSLD